VFSSHLEFQMMAEVHKPSDSERTVTFTAFSVAALDMTATFPDTKN
jgi:hypothetical protein